MSDEELVECNWCGAEIEDGSKRYRDRINGIFCSKSHRDESTRAVKRLHKRIQQAGRMGDDVPGWTPDEDKEERGHEA